MQLAVLGVNFKTAPIELREKFSFIPSKVPPAIQHIRENIADIEIVLISTCNRTELYIAGSSLEANKDKLAGLLAETANTSLDEAAISHFYMKTNVDAINHLMSVCSSLDSMVIGETEILGQVKQAYASAVETQPDCKLLHRLFQEAIRTAKRVHTETAISHGRVSVSSIAVDFAQKVFDDLSSKTAMIVGAGETGELTLKSLIEHGIKNVMVVNRSVHKGDTLAREYGGESISFDDLDSRIAETDIVISSTSAPHCVIKADTVKRALSERKNKPILLIDIAVPRDIEHEIAALDNVYLYDIDDLQKITEENMAKRQKAVDKARDIVNKESTALAALCKDNSLPVLMKDLTLFVDDIKNEEIKKVLNKEAFNSLDELQKEEMEALIDRVANRLMGPTRRHLTETRHNGRWEQLAEFTRELFNLK